MARASGGGPTQPRIVPIEGHGLIGDSRSAALVASDGTIDWLAWPRFESGSLFASIVDSDRPEKAGLFRLRPRERATQCRQEYLPESNVLVTTIETGTGVLEIIDAMIIPALGGPPELAADHEIVRVARVTKGEVTLDAKILVRPDYGRDAPRPTQVGALGVRFEFGRDLLNLRSELPLTIGEASDGLPAVRAGAKLRAGQRAIFSLSFDDEAPSAIRPLGAAALGRLDATDRAWRAWSQRTVHEGPYRDAVVRSALALKLLVFAASGAVVAAPTTSLPERIGGTLNWDYRYCWLRDASLTVRALFSCGHREEAAAFASWLVHTTRLTRPELHVLYDVYGEPLEEEELLGHLGGFARSRPVRVRNAAANQLQLDVYGEVVDAVYELVRRGGEVDRDTKDLLRDIAGFVSSTWACADHGIWEPRAEPRYYTHSRLLCWVALDRMTKMAQMRVAPGLDAGLLAGNRDACRRSIQTSAWNASQRTYTDILGGEGVDASLLLFAAYGFDDAASFRLRSTQRMIRERLGCGPGLLYRHELSRKSREGAFVVCGFWEVEQLARGGGTLGEARRAFDSLLRRANGLGLFAEEIDPASGAALGNFPQAFSHVGVLRAAAAIARRESAARRSRFAELRGPADRAPEARHP